MWLARQLLCPLRERHYLCCTGQEINQNCAQEGEIFYFYHESCSESEHLRQPGAKLSVPSWRNREKRGYKSPVGVLRMSRHVYYNGAILRTFALHQGAICFQEVSGLSQSWLGKALLSALLGFACGQGLEPRTKT